jgi:predicted ester cyclase
MSENERIVREFYRLFVKRDFDGIRELLHEDFRWVGASNKEWGFDKLLNSGLKDTGAFPDLQIKIKRVLTQDDIVVVEYDWVGTHEVELWGIEPTKKKVKVPFAEFWELEDDKLKFWRVYANMILQYLQITGKPYPFHST